MSRRHLAIISSLLGCAAEVEVQPTERIASDLVSMECSHRVSDDSSLDVVFLIDASSSMEPHLESIERVARGLGPYLPGGSKVGLVWSVPALAEARLYAGQTGKWVDPLVAEDLVREAVEGPRSSSSSGNIFTAMDQVNTKLARRRSRLVLAFWNSDDPDAGVESASLQRLLDAVKTGVTPSWVGARPGSPGCFASDEVSRLHERGIVDLGGQLADLCMPAEVLDTVVLAVTAWSETTYGFQLDPPAEGPVEGWLWQGGELRSACSAPCGTLSDDGEVLWLPRKRLFGADTLTLRYPGTP